MNTLGLEEIEKKELQNIEGGGMSPAGAVTVAVALWGAWYNAWYALGEAYGNYTK